MKQVISLMTSLHPSTNCPKYHEENYTWKNIKYYLIFFNYPLELAKGIPLFYHIGHLFGFTGEELLLLLLYSCFNYKLAFYSILMSKYLIMSSFPLFSIHLHQHMLTLRLESYYFQVLSCINLLPVLWPDHPLHASKHLNTHKILPLMKQNEFI